MRSVLKAFGDDVIPESIVEQATKALSSTFSPIFTGEQDFYDAVKSAIQSVELAVSSELVGQCTSQVGESWAETHFPYLPDSRARGRRTLLP